MLTNVAGRRTVSLDGRWRSIVDPYGAGSYDYRLQPLENPWGKNEKPKTESDRIEYDFDASPELAVPGDWNSQRPELELYEGAVWYKTSFDYTLAPGRRAFLHFGAANYEAIVYLNGERVGKHVGGFTPFQLEVTEQLHPTDNVLIVEVDDARRRDAVPSVNTDWWNFGGLTRSVALVDVPQTFVRDYFVAIDPVDRDSITGWVKVDGPDLPAQVTVAIGETGPTQTVTTDAQGLARVHLPAQVERWSDRNPKRYAVRWTTSTDEITEPIGFRTIETKGSDILLNGKPIFLRGISIHEQAPNRKGRATSEADARKLLGWAKELGANFVRLAHYPHNEHMIRVAEELGLLVWSEVPVYWTLLWNDPDTLANARQQLREMIARDKNRAAVLLWSVANETPISTSRNAFLTALVDEVRELDPTRLVTAALERRSTEPDTYLIDDPLGRTLDVIGVNEYIGWYDGLPSRADEIRWETPYDKPLIASEFGAGALAGRHGTPLTRWTEEYQRSVYEHQLRMLAKIPTLRGMSPWILCDFQSPRRPLPRIQDYWNRKGLISDQGQKKAAFAVLQQYYRRLASESGTK